MTRANRYFTTGNIWRINRVIQLVDDGCVVKEPDASYGTHFDVKKATLRR